MLFLCYCFSLKVFILRRRLRRLLCILSAMTHRRASHVTSSTVAHTAGLAHMRAVTRMASLSRSAHQLRSLLAYFWARGSITHIACNIT